LRSFLNCVHDLFSCRLVHHVIRSTNAMNRLRHFVVQPREKLSRSVIKDLILLNDPSLYCSERV
jgi:hypothetical protein